MKLWIRCDASPNVGLGHLMREVALAEVAQGRGASVAFVCQPGAVVDRIAAARGVDLRAPAGNDWLRGVHPGDVVVFDGYQLGAQDHEDARGRGAFVVVVDDEGRTGLRGDLVVNPNLVGADAYPDRRGALRVGPDYALVREEFRRRRRRRRPGRRQAVVSMGGGDAGAVTAAVAGAVRDAGFDEVRVLLGPAAADLDAGTGITSIRSDDVASVFDEADAVVAAAGATAWELLTMGLPVALVEVAPNQRFVGRPLGELGAALFLGTLPEDLGAIGARLAPLARPDVQEALGERGRSLVDGNGAARVLDAVVELAGGRRPAG